MKRKISFISLLCAAAACAAPAGSVKDIAEKLAGIDDYHGRVTYSVLLPQAEDPVVYELELWSDHVEGDTLSACDYLIESVYNGEKGFAAYFDGNHYRYRGQRLQEYHYAWDSIPLQMGVQRQAQFADVLPQYLGRELARLAADSCFSGTFASDTLYGGRRASVLKGRLTYRGYVSKEVVYVFDPETWLPRVVEMENNPGAISEQSVTVTYDNLEPEEMPARSDDRIVERYPELFERFRQSNFKVENLAGTRMPSFSAPMPLTEGGRFTYHRGEKLDAPTLIVVLDDAVASAEATVKAVRDGVDRAPLNVDVLWAFTTNNVERAEEIAGRLRPGEHLLVGARGLARDCGVTATPTVIYVGRDGTVSDVTLGYNKDMAAIVIQKITLIN